MPAETQNASYFGINDPIVDAENANDVGLGGQLAAAFNRENVAVTLYRMATDDRQPLADDPSFDLQAHLHDHEFAYADQFEDVRSVAQLARAREEISREQEWNRALEDGPLPAWSAAMFAAVADPTIFLGAGGLLLKAGRGASVGARTVLGGVGAASDAALSEAILQADQRARSTEESAVNIAAAAALGTVLGGVIGVSANRAGELVKDVEVLANADPALAPDSVGAMARVSQDRLTGVDTELAPALTGTAGRVSKALTRIGLGSASVELMSSPVAKVREFANRLTEHGMVLKGHLRGATNAASVENRIRGYDTAHLIVGRTLTRGFKEARSAARKTGQNYLTRSQFRDEVGRALRRLDTHPDPHVEKAAKQLREQILVPFRDEAIKLGLLPEQLRRLGPRDALSYFTRVYDREAIKRRPGEFIQMTVDDLRFKVDEANRIGSPHTYTDAELREIAEDIMHQIIGVQNGRAGQEITINARGPLKERTWHISDFVLDKHKFLVDDAEEVLSRYVRSMSADLELAREFGKGNPNFKLGDIKKLLRAEVNDEVTAAVQKKGVTEEAARKLRDDASEAVAKLDLIIDRFRGLDPSVDSVFGSYKFADGLKAARTANVMTMLGGVVLSSIGDAGSIILQHGMFRTFKHLIPELATGFRAIRASKVDAQRMAFALDWEMATSMVSRWDVGERAVTSSRLTRAIDRAGTWGGRITLLSGWNDILKRMSGTVASTRVLGAAEKLAGGGKLTKQELAWMAQSGLDEAMLKQIAKQSSHWLRAPGGIVPNLEKWTDGTANVRFRDAIRRSVNTTVLTPGIADAPMWTGTAWGKVIFQFKRFGWAANQHLLIRSGQRLRAGDLTVLSGMTALLATGMLARWAKDVSKGVESDYSAAEWVNEGLAMGGAASIFYEMDELADNFSGLSAQRLLLGSTSKRFEGRKVGGYSTSKAMATLALGPTGNQLAKGLSLVQDTTEAIKGENGYDSRSAANIRYLVPYNNLFYARWLFDRLQENAGRALDEGG